MHYPLTDIQADFDINQPIRYQITAKRNCFDRRQTDRLTDRQTDGQTNLQGQHPSTLIDNILTNVIELNYDKAGILISQISDHQAIFLSTNSKLSRDSGSKYINVEKKTTHR